MPIEATIIGHDHRNGKEGQATLNNPSGRPIGLMVYTERFAALNPEIHPFLNDDFGAAMNQNVSFSGTPELIHDGTDTASWTGAIVAGTWDLSDTTNPSDGSNCVSLTNGVEADQTTYDDGTTTDMSGYTALTGQMRLETYNATTNSIILAFDLAGTAVGNSVDLNDYLDTGLLDAYQGFVIPKDDFGLSGQTIDALTMTLSRTGGPKATFRFDELQWEQTGTPAVYKSTTPDGTRFHVTEILVSVADAFTGIVTASTTTYPTMTGLPYDALLGVSALSNGIVFIRVQDGKVASSQTLRQLSDFLDIGANLVNMISDGTNTFIGLLIRFPEPIILDGKTGDFMSLTINDNLSGLLSLTAVARGALEA